MTYNIGQILTANQDIVTEREFSGTQEVLPKGTKLIVGVDGFAHNFRDCSMMNLPEGASVSGHNPYGLSEWIYKFLKANLPIQEWLDDYEIDAEEVKACITEALEELGMC